MSLSQQRGHPVLLNFWATWCPPCVDEVPALEDLARRLKGTDMRMLAVSVDDDWDQIRRFFAKGSDIGVLLDTSHDVPKKFGTEKYPETFMIDAAGPRPLLLHQQARLVAARSGRLSREPALAPRLRV